jgi:hypothetical protein
MLELAHRLIGEAANMEGNEYWSLVGRLAVTLGVPFAVPIVLMFFWFGQISTRVDSIDRNLAETIHTLGGIVALSAMTDERTRSSAIVIDKLRDKVDGLLERDQAPLTKGTTP